MTWRLSGRLVTDRGDASGTGYWSPGEERYRYDLLAIVDGDRDWTGALPDVLGAVEPAGTWRDAVVGPGTGDNMAAALGLGLEPGDVAMSIGTSGTVFAVSDQPSADPSGAVAGFADANGRFLPLVCTLQRGEGHRRGGPAAGPVRGRARRRWRSPRHPARAVGAAALPRRRTHAGSTRRDRCPRRDPLRRRRRGGGRAAHEGVVCSLLDGLDALGAHARLDDGRLWLVGGGARSGAYRAGPRRPVGSTGDTTDGSTRRSPSARACRPPRWRAGPTRRRWHATGVPPARWAGAPRPNRRSTPRSPPRSAPATWRDATGRAECHDVVPPRHSSEVERFVSRGYIVYRFANSASALLRSLGQPELVRRPRLNWANHAIDVGVGVWLSRRLDGRGTADDLVAEVVEATAGAANGAIGLAAPAHERGAPRDRLADDRRAVARRGDDGVQRAVVGAGRGPSGRSCRRTCSRSRRQRSLADAGLVWGHAATLGGFASVGALIADGMRRREHATSTAAPTSWRGSRSPPAAHKAETELRQEVLSQTLDVMRRIRAELRRGSRRMRRAGADRGGATSCVDQRDAMAPVRSTGHRADRRGHRRGAARPRAAALGGDHDPRHGAPHVRRQPDRQSPHDAVAADGLGAGSDGDRALRDGRRAMRNSPDDLPYLAVAAGDTLMMIATTEWEEIQPDPPVGWISAYAMACATTTATMGTPRDGWAGPVALMCAWRAMADLPCPRHRRWRDARRGWHARRSTSSATRGCRTTSRTPASDRPATSSRPPRSWRSSAAAPTSRSCDSSTRRSCTTARSRCCCGSARTTSPPSRSRTGSTRRSPRVERAARGEPDTPTRRSGRRSRSWPRVSGASACRSRSPMSTRRRPTPSCGVRWSRWSTRR